MCISFNKRMYIQNFLLALLCMLSGRHDEEKISLHVALSSVVNGMNELAACGHDHVFFFSSMLPIKVVSRKLNGISSGILVNLTRICPNLMLNVLRIGVVSWDWTDSDRVVEGDTSRLGSEGGSGRRKTRGCRFRRCHGRAFLSSVFHGGIFSGHILTTQTYLFVL